MFNLKTTTSMEEKGLNYFRIKTEYVSEASSGTLNKRKAEELVLASCYTEAEKLTHDLIESFDRRKFGSVTYEIIKTKISDVLFNEILSQDEDPVSNFQGNFFEEDENSPVGLYAVKVIFITLDEKNGKEKTSTETFHVPASSNIDAANRINAHLKGTLLDYVIRDIKFDKAEAIYWPSDVHNNKVNNYRLN